MTDPPPFLEKTTEIDEAHHEIPRANWIIYAVITVLCLLYLLFCLRP